MKPSRSLLFTLALINLFFIFFPAIVQAQPPDIDPAFDPDLPLDGGVGVLIAIGVGYGLKKMRDHQKRDRKKI